MSTIRENSQLTHRLPGINSVDNVLFWINAKRERLERPLLLLGDCLLRMMHTYTTRFFLDDSDTPPDVRDDRGDTPLNTAALAGQVAAVEELLVHGADVNTKNNKVRSMYVNLVGRAFPDRSECSAVYPPLNAARLSFQVQYFLPMSQIANNPFTKALAQAL